MSESYYIHIQDGNFDTIPLAESVHYVLVVTEAVVIDGTLSHLKKKRLAWMFHNKGRGRGRRGGGFSCVYNILGIDRRGGGEEESGDLG